jgi:uncharacterized membrane protein YuzA (DUF378 family)
MCGKNKGCSPIKIAKWLVIIGGVNWGFVGLGMLIGKSWNLVNMIFGGMPSIEAIIYVLVGVAAVMKIFGCKCKKCDKCPGGVCGGEVKVEEKPQ